MNELEFIRRQVSTERSHMAAVRGACAAALAGSPGERPDVDFLLACARYLAFIVRRFNAQDQAHCDLLRPRLPAGAARDRATLDDLEQTLAASRTAIDALTDALRVREAAGADTDADDAAFVAALRAYLSFYSNVLASRRHALHHLFDAYYDVADWRAASAVDADSILEERRLHAQVAERLPEGVALAALASDAPPLASPAPSSSANRPQAATQPPPAA